MRPLDEVFTALAKSQFRRRQKLSQADAAYLARLGIERAMEHAEDIVRQRLAPAHPANDGRQTPMRGHPVFVAQHATGTCCRNCLRKWHHIAPGKALSDDEIRYVLAVLRRWLESQPIEFERSRDDRPTLFDRLERPDGR
ncbi:MAG: DUF4186 domain-containing protein [Planctomycetota bacterium]|nr:MAG: DUF4186 domain-containing protein [Planctomycetota bacterium]